MGKKVKKSQKTSKKKIVHSNFPYFLHKPHPYNLAIQMIPSNLNGSENSTFYLPYTLLWEKKSKNHKKHQKKKSYTATFLIFCINLIPTTLPSKLYHQI